MHEGKYLPIPNYETLMLPVLRLIGDGAQNVAECIPHLKQLFQISDEEAEELLPSGRITVLQSRTHWARTYLSKAGLLTSPKRNLHVITEQGRAVLTQDLEKLDNAFLDQFPEFTAWRTQSSDSATRQQDDRTSPTGSAPLDSQTPEDAMRVADKRLKGALADELSAILFDITPQRFERVILDLLAAMGFGSGNLENGHMTKSTGDGGIDGIIHEDALGLDAVYVQAKRYAADNKVGRPDIQRFVGSLTGEGATKGVFVTTSDFSREALDYVQRVQHRIVLVNGQQFAELLIQHGVGVRVRSTYTVFGIDEDYF